METLYRRPLPEDTIAFASPEGQRLFGEALAAGGLGGYFALAEQYQTQSDPAFCGLGSLVVALNALAIDPGRLWKGPWRWFSEELLDCCVSLEQVRAQGVDLDTLACLARCNGAEAVVLRSDGIDELRRTITQAAAGAGEVIIAAYDRQALGQTGAGHFSPIGGYHAPSDRVLVLDVARFKYPPHWVPLTRLAAAMATIDPTTGRRRGALVVRRREGHQGIMLSLACAGAAWPEVARRLREALSRTWPADASLSDVAASLVGLTEHCVARQPETSAHAAAIAEVLGALRATEAHRIASTVASGSGADATAALLLVFAGVHRGHDGDGDGVTLSRDLARIGGEAERIPALAAELERLAAQSEAIRATWATA
ncbi:MAG TPA: phytochelatin synthase family protein [Kofleriaceae bacterium]|nr:phytochelatin synthase family protein [Kofleriaceae bacterium]